MARVIVDLSHDADVLSAGSLSMRRARRPELRAHRVDG